MSSVPWVLVVLGAVGILGAVGLAIIYRSGGFVMKRNTRYVFPLAVIFPAALAFWYAQYLIENFFPYVTLIDLGAFYAIGLISGLSAGLSLGLQRR
jgi:hypothetical protein